MTYSICGPGVQEKCAQGLDTPPPQPLNYASQQCAQIFVDFMLDYPHEHKAMQLRITHLLKNLGYAEEGGRRAALNCLYLVVLHFPEVELSTKWGSLIFAATAARLPQESDPTAHQMLHAADADAACRGQCDSETSILLMLMHLMLMMHVVAAAPSYNLGS
ncbi:U3 small nucleolar RNA-associated protein 20 [Symbiodinium microadriaticum]|uniref:U3 small nucleolar RNA-associated protein 20 n=1 Tax=Symbiodinium microadriaticum TaxID=2951 RepID=A0A1Q9DN65_SYMMI|nr:U3 small nucleolar RNA-associated protein 20 [Symbiodinium microadriaticum]